MKKLPIGIQSIRKIIDRDYVYVDKTDLIYNLINQGECYFLSRPRRFGKSLLLSTLQAIFKGERELFKNFHIHKTDYGWEKHPVIYLDFTKIPTQNPEKLASALQRVLGDIAFSYNKSIKCPSPEEGLVNLVTALADLGPVVVLIDEYDSPIIDHFENADIAKGNQALLKNFYRTLKALDEQLRFVFATGVTKFSQVSLFSGFNNLHDLTIDPSYATLLGYTATDLQKFLGDRIKKLAEDRQSAGVSAADEEAVLAEMKEWYNGYRFAWGTETVYNPHSVLSFLKTGRLENYWFRTGTPTLLVQQIRKQPTSVLHFGEVLAEESRLLDVNNLARLHLTPLMWQTGYLTIHEYDQASQTYKLDFPNREVRQAFFNTLLNEFAELDAAKVGVVAARCKQQLEQQEFVPFIATMQSLFARIPSTLFKKESEASYHAIFLIVLEAMGIKVQAELLTNVGRIDLVLEMQNCVYIMELKFNKKSIDAIKQIEEKDYKRRYVIDGKDLVLMGINFSSKDRNISDWKAIVYRPDSSKIKQIDIRT